jgi:hypothetical protein
VYKGGDVLSSTNPLVSPSRRNVLLLPTEETEDVSHSAHTMPDAIKEARSALAPLPVNRSTRDQNR